MSDSVILWTVGQAPLYMEFSSQEYCSGLPFSLPVDLPDLETEPMSLMFPPLASDFFATSTIWEAPSVEVNPQIQCYVVLAHPPLIIGSDSKAFPHQDDFCWKYHRPVNASQHPFVLKVSSLLSQSRGNRKSHFRKLLSICLLSFGDASSQLNTI